MIEKKLATYLTHGLLRLFVNQNFMLTCNKIKSHVNIIISHVNIFMLHVNIIMLHVDINKSHVNIDISHVDKIYLACRGQNYATIEHRLSLDNWFSGHMVKDHGVASGFRSKHRLFNIFQQLDCYHIFTNFNIYCSLEIFIMVIFYGNRCQLSNSCSTNIFRIDSNIFHHLKKKQQSH